MSLWRSPMSVFDHFGKAALAAATLRRADREKRGTVGQDLLGRGIDDLHGLVASDQFAIDQEHRRFHGIPFKKLVLGASEGRGPTGARLS